MGVKFCTQCGKKNDSGNRFCIYCGHPFAEDEILENVEEIENGESNVEEELGSGAVPLQKIPMSLYEKHKIREKHEPVKTFEFWKVLFLLIITCGIYGIYVGHHLIQGLNKVCEGDEEESPNIFKVIFFSIFTYGVYALYWSCVQSQRMYEAGKGYRAEVKEKGWTILLWETVGCVLFWTGPVVALYKIIKNYNLLAERYNQGVVNYKIREMSQEERDKKKSRKKIAKVVGIVYAVLLALGAIISIIDSSRSSGGKLSSEKTKIITTLKDKTDFRTDYVEQWKETFYRFTYDDKWVFQYSENGCSVRINEPLVQECFAEGFGDTEIGNDSTFAYTLSDNCVSMYFDYETSQGKLSIVMYDIDKDEYTLMIDGDKYAASDEVNDYLKEYGLDRILKQDINDFKTDLSAMDLTVQDLEQINHKDLEEYMKGK